MKTVFALLLLNILLPLPATTDDCPPNTQPACVTVYYESIYAGDIYAYKEFVCSEAEAKDYIRRVNVEGFEDDDNTVNDHIPAGALRRMDWILLPPGATECEK